MNVLLPYDISPVSQRAVQTALELVRGQRDVHITAVHFSGGEDHPAEIAASEIESMGAEYEVTVDAEIRAIERDPESKSAIREAITGIIEADDIDLVVLGHEEKSLFEEIVYSDTSERALENYGTPVLLVP